MRNHNYVFILLLFVTLIILPSILNAEEKMDSCVLCHQELDKELSSPVTGMKEDIHHEKGLSCADCHGGDSSIGFTEMDYTIAMDKKKGYVGVPKPNEIPQFCAKCHGNINYMKKFNPAMRTDQLEQYKTSGHGKRIIKGDTKVANCVSCHSVHGIRAVKDPQSPVYPSNIPLTCSKCHSNAEYMKSYKIPTDQFEKYKESVHGIALLQKGDVRSAPACNSCHGNHGAAPPEVSSVIHACGQCHAQNEELFQESPHKDAFAKNNLGACDACHSHHDVKPTSDTMIGSGKESTCIKCHKTEDKGYMVSTKIAEEIQSLKTAIQKAEMETERAVQYGRDVSIPRQKIKEAKDALIISRTIVHTVSTEKIEKVTKPAVGFTEEAIKLDKEATMDLAFRYIGLTVFLIVALIMAGLIYLKVRQLEK